MPLALLPDVSFSGPALPEPFVRFELEAALAKVGLLPRAAGAEGRALQEDWERYRRRLRELVAAGGPLRVRNHVVDPLVSRLGYARLEPAGEVLTREGREDGGDLLITDDGAARLRIWAVELEADLDAPARRGAAYRYSHVSSARRVLLVSGERLGLITNGVQLRLLISDPARPDSQVIIPIDPLWKQSRALPDSFRLLLALASPAGVLALPALVDLARLQQARVTRELRAQARRAVEGFIQEVLDHPENRGQVSGFRFQVSGDGAQISGQGDANLTPDTWPLTPELTPDTWPLTPETLWREGLVLIYRLLFVLKLESSDDPARAFSFASTSLWRNTFSPSVAMAPFARRVLDAGAETGRLLEDGLRALFRLFAEGVRVSELKIEPLGALFGAAAMPTLDGMRWGERAVARLLDNLLWTPARGREGRERVYYGPLDVEDLGRVYEALLELEPGIAGEPMCRLRRQKLEVVLPLAQGVRYQVSGFRGQVLGVSGQGSGQDDANLKPETWNLTPELTSTGGDHEHQQLPGSAGVAEGDGSGGRVLQADRGLPQERDLRAEQPASEGGGLSAGEHRGGAGTGIDQGISPSPLDRERLTDGTGDAPADRGQAALRRGSGVDTAAGPDVGGGQDADWADQIIEGEAQDLTPGTWDLEPDSDEDELTPGTRNLKPTKVEWIEAIAPGRFYLRVGLGRKATGSYYTPHSFVRFLVQETLGPQCDERSPQADPRPGALIRIRVLDPAMGSGHFLVEACRFLGIRVYEACRRCDELATEAESAALRCSEPGERAALEARAQELRARVRDLPDPDDALERYLPSRAAEGAGEGVSRRIAEAICRRLAAVHCLYGVDKNPLAIELAKLSLWIEAHAEGLPLTFLDHRLVVGDSLTGPFVEHLFRFPGSQKPFADDLFARDLRARLGHSLSAALVHVADLEASVGVSLADLEHKRGARARLDAALAPFRLLAAAWAGGVMLGKGGCDDDEYARFARKVSGARFQVSGEDGAGLEPDTWHLTPALQNMIARGLGLRHLPEAVQTYGDALALLLKPETWNLIPALPYDLAFPEVFYPGFRFQGSGFSDDVSGAMSELTPETSYLTPFPARAGFDVVVGNPPWDRMLPADKEFFAAFEFTVLDAATKRERESIERRLQSDPLVATAHAVYIEEFRSTERVLDKLYSYQVVEIDGEKTIGKLDAFRVFMERNAQMLGPTGLTGVVVPSAFHANEGATGVRRLYFEQMATRSCYSFENRNKLFEIHSSFKFAPIVAVRQGPTEQISCAFYLHDDGWLFEHGEREPLTYSLDFVRRTGGDYLSLLELRSAHDAEVARICFANGEPFGQVCERLGIRLGRELNMTDDAWRFTPTSQVLPGGEDPRDPDIAPAILEQGYLVLHEGKTFHQYTDRWEARPRYLVPQSHLSEVRNILSNTQQFRLSYREIASGTNERTVIFALLPPGIISGHKGPNERTPFTRPTCSALMTLGLGNSFTFDWLMRLKVQSTVMLFYLLANPTPTSLKPDPRNLTPETRHLKPFLAHSALRLTCNHAGYAALWREQVGDAWREEREPLDWPALKGDDARWAVRAAIDAVVAEAYGLSRAQYAHVLSTFSHKSYPKAPGLCLAAFDELKELGLEAFTQQHDPYWDIPLNAALPEPVIQVLGVSSQVSGSEDSGRSHRPRGRAGTRNLKPETSPQLALDLGEATAPAQQVIDFAAAAARRGRKKAAEDKAGYQVPGARSQVSEGEADARNLNPETLPET